MSFTVDEFKGYKEGERYEKKLKYVKMFGNSNERSVIFRDENGSELHWRTTDYTKTYKSLKMRGTYKFTIDHIINPDIDITSSNIKIRNLKIRE